MLNKLLNIKIQGNFRQRDGKIAIHLYYIGNNSFFGRNIFALFLPTHFKTFEINFEF